MMLFLAYSCIAHVCGIKGVGSRIARGEVRPTSCKMGQLTCNMGLELMRIYIRASKATTPSKGFLPKKRLTSPYYYKKI
jgi:hypothetical protein